MEPLMPKKRKIKSVEMSRKRYVLVNYNGENMEKSL